MIGIPFYFWSTQPSKDLALAARLFKTPQLVYWAQPVAMPAAARHRHFFRATVAGMQIYDNETEDAVRLAAGRAGIWEYVHLHFRDGGFLEIRLSTREMGVFMAWLAESDPSLRIARYYGEDGAPPE